MSKKRVIVACFGQGGHETQMRRLVSSLDIDPDDLIVITDSLKSFECLNKVSILEVRNKDRVGYFNMVKNCIINVRMLFGIMFKYKVVSMLSTGPGICILAGVVLKISGANIVHIETWSRFYSKSLTGQFMYYLADRFYVQNKECLSLYRKAIYSGRL